MKTNQIICGETLKTLKTFPDESIDMVMTSPPYWGLRDYKVKGQLGLEPTFNLYINHLCDIFDEIKRVLKKEGTCWVNLGDTYGGHGGTSKPEHLVKAKVANTLSGKQFRGGNSEGNLKIKCLGMIPFRFAIEMTNRGWILRNVIIWHKPNCMPSSVKDRFTVDFEYLFFFSKNKKYYFETQYEKRKDTWGGRWGKMPKGNRPNAMIGRKEMSKEEFEKHYDENRNKRTVWSICTHPFKEAHFAVYPEKLCQTPIRAGCPKEGIVLDPFCGSGTTCIVAKKLGRDYIGIDLNEEYCKMARKRLSKVEKPLFNH